jgi:hypothetical protein
MRKYRINVRDGVTYADPTGSVLEDDQAAIAEAAQVARELKSDHGPDVADWLIEVKDGKRVVARIPFRNVD